jgi:hypothetical protein
MGFHFWTGESQAGSSAFGFRPSFFNELSIGLIGSESVSVKAARGLGLAPEIVWIEA